MKTIKTILASALLANVLLSPIDLVAQKAKPKAKDTTGHQDIQDFLNKYQTFQSKRQLKNARRLNEASTNSADYETPLTSYVRQQLPTPLQTQESHPMLPPVELQRIQFSNQINSSFISNNQQQIIEAQTLWSNKEIEITKQQVRAVELSLPSKQELDKKQLQLKKKTTE